MANDLLEAELYELWRKERDKYSDAADRYFCTQEMNKHIEGYLRVRSTLDRDVRLANVGQTGVNIAAIMLIFFLCSVCIVGAILILR